MTPLRQRMQGAMTVRVTADKGGADRYRSLSPSLLALLRPYSQTLAL